MRPSARTSTVIGIPLTWYPSNVERRASATQAWIGFLARNGATVFSRSCVNATNCTGSPLNWSAGSLMWGVAATQGARQVAQNASPTSLGGLQQRLHVDRRRLAAGRHGGFRREALACGPEQTHDQGECRQVLHRVLR